MSRLNTLLHNQVVLIKNELNDIKTDLERVDERYLSTLKDLTDNNNRLSERVSVLEANYNHIMNRLEQIQRDTSLQTRLIVALLMAVVSTTITAVLKYYFNLF